MERFGLHLASAGLTGLFLICLGSIVGWGLFDCIIDLKNKVDDKLYPMSGEEAALMHSVFESMWRYE